MEKHPEHAAKVGGAAQVARRTQTLLGCQGGARANFHEGWKKARAPNFRLRLSPTDPEIAANERGGAGFPTPLQFCVTVMPTATSTFAKAVALGSAYRMVARVGRRAATPYLRHIWLRKGARVPCPGSENQLAGAAQQGRACCMGRHAYKPGKQSQL